MIISDNYGNVLLIYLKCFNFITILFRMVGLVGKVNLIIVKFEFFNHLLVLENITRAERASAGPKKLTDAVLYSSRLRGHRLGEKKKN